MDNLSENKLPLTIPKLQMKSINKLFNVVSSQNVIETEPETAPPEPSKKSKDENFKPLFREQFE